MPRLRKSVAIDYSKGHSSVLRQVRKRRGVEDKPELENVEHRSEGILSFLTTCRGPECPFASRCPVSSDPSFVGTGCVMELAEAYNHFLEYMVSLNIQPSDYTDIQMVLDLVRTHILSWRIDQMLSLEGMMQENITVQGNRSSVTRVSHPLLAEQRALLRERQVIYDKLMASRRARLEREQMEGRAQLDFARMLTQIAQRAKGSIQVLDSPPAIAALGSPSETTEEEDDG